MTPALAAHGITLQLEALDQLGMVALHNHTLQRALLNLVQNAMEAMPPGGTLTLRGRRQGAAVHLDVRDTGIGIPPEQTTQIFEPLHTTKPGGTGLGLYIVQEVVAAHGGQVAVQSVVGQGPPLRSRCPCWDREERRRTQRTLCPLGWLFYRFAPNLGKRLPLPRRTPWASSLKVSSAKLSTAPGSPRMRRPPIRPPPPCL